MSEIHGLQKWYEFQCDGDWEHSHGITIETMDNPGWKISVCLKDTLLENVRFDGILEGNPESKSASWLYCYKEDGFFIGMCSSKNLEKTIRIFIKWAEDNTDTSPWDDLVNDLIQECKLPIENSTKISRLREIYNKIEDVPNEHPRKRELVKLFDKCWHDLINKRM